MTPADLAAMLAADLSDRATRLILADALTDLLREPEAELCRDLGRPIRVAEFGTLYEGEPSLGLRVIDFDHTWVEWLPDDDAHEVRHVRGPWEESPRNPVGRVEARFMSWFGADERLREGWETSVLYVRGPFRMTDAHETMFRETVREHALECMRSDERTWAIRWPDGVVEQEPQGLALVQR